MCTCDPLIELFDATHRVWVCFECKAERGEKRVYKRRLTETERLERDAKIYFKEPTETLRALAWGESSARRSSSVTHTSSSQIHMQRAQ